MKSKLNKEVSSEEKYESKDILPIFWDLASTDEEKRVESVVHLVSIFKGKAEEKNNMNEKKISEDLTYTLKRLVKGSGSSRKGARQGFGTALTEILKNFAEVKSDMIYDLMEEHLSVKGSFEAQEERDALFGQAFCHAALIQNFSSDMENYGKHIERTVQALLILMKRKSYLLELCTKLIIDLLDKIDAKCFKDIVFPILKEDSKRGWKDCTPERFCILLAAERHFKDSIGTSFLETNWSCAKLFGIENMEEIAKILMESTINAHPRMHLVWKEVFPHILASNEGLKAFWTTVVEDNLMQSTHERKFLAFNVLQEMFAKISKSQVEIVISDRLLKSIINSCSSDKNYLYSAGKNLLACIPSQIAKNENDGVALATINQIIQKSATLSFDVLTKTKTVESLIGQLNPNNVVHFISWLKKIFLDGKVEEISSDEENDDKETVSQNRKWAASQMLLVMRSANLKKEETWLLDVAKFLFFHGHFHTVKKKSKDELYVLPDPEIEENVIGLCRERFIGALSELSNIHLSSEDSSSVKAGSNYIPGTLKNGDYYAYDLVTFAQGLLQDSKYVALNKEWKPEAKEVFDEALEIVQKIREKVPRQSAMSEERAFELLFLHSCLQMFDKTDEAADVIQELVQCYKKLKEKKKKKKSDEEPHWSEVLTEILLSFLAQSSHMMRQIVNMVFSIILPHITHTAFQLIIEALRPKKNIGEDGLEIVNDSDEEGEMVGPEMESDDEDDDDDDDENGKDSSDDESENDAGEIDEAFRSEIKLALGEAADVSDESDSDDDNDDSDMDMDTVDPKVLDSMDKALAAAFKTRQLAKSGKKKKQEEKKTIVHFRLRVLDIAELIVKKQPKSQLILDLIEPLLEVIKVSAMYKEEKELHDRAQGILKNKICHAREIPNGDDVDKENVHVKIEDLIKLAQNASSVQMVNLITQSCMFLIRVLRGKEDLKEPSPLKTRKQREKQKKIEDKETAVFGSIDCQRIVTCYQNALDDFMTRRNSHLQPIVFLEFIKRYPAIAWKLASSLAIYISKAVNNFRKVQACEMIMQLISRKSECSDEDFKDFGIPLQQELIKIFKHSCDENFSMKAKHLHEVVKLTDKFIKENKSKLNLPFDNQLVISIKAAVEGPIMKRSPQLMAYCKKIINLLSEGSSLSPNRKNRKRKGGSTEPGNEEKINGRVGEEKKEEKIEISTDADDQMSKKKKKKRKEK